MEKWLGRFPCSHGQRAAGDLLAEQIRIARSSLTLSVMYEHLATVPGIRFIDYPGELLVADTDHKWGVPPFHYPEAYV